MLQKIYLADTQQESFLLASRSLCTLAGRSYGSNKYMRALLFLENKNRITEILW